MIEKDIIHILSKNILKAPEYFYENMQVLTKSEGILYE